MWCADVLDGYLPLDSSSSSYVGGKFLVLSELEGECGASQLVVFTQQDFTEYLASPFKMSVSDGASISGAILLVWAAAWGVRVLIRTLNSTDTE